MAVRGQKGPSALRSAERFVAEYVDERIEDEPVVLEEVDPSEGTSPPEDWDSHAHEDDEDVWEGVETSAAASKSSFEAARGKARSINGFSVGPAKRIGVKTYRVPGTKVSLPVRAIIAPLLIGFAKEFHQKVERLRKGWCWGHANRNIRGSKRPSFHAAGIAIDLNAPKHPLGRKGTFSAAQRKTINALCKKYGLRWGGNYRRRKDEMHFEVILPRAKAVALAKRIQKRGAR
ncbi:M15 family peptidase [Polyangium fumosum]|uniref:M15 family peptidase n=1 Tax=Polyangium fumosum TaxID=889272 RepID=A0A4V5PL78_9BACT|nr:M15 family peptidase [Polyangium fumosum]